MKVSKQDLTRPTWTIGLSSVCCRSNWRHRVECFEYHYLEWSLPNLYCLTRVGCQSIFYIHYAFSGYRRGYEGRATLSFKGFAALPSIAAVIINKTCYASPDLANSADNWHTIIPSNFCEMMSTSFWMCRLPRHYWTHPKMPNIPAVPCRQLRRVYKLCQCCVFDVFSCLYMQALQLEYSRAVVILVIRNACAEGPLFHECWRES